MIFFLHPQYQWRKESDPEIDPDPLVRGTDPAPKCHGSQHWFDKSLYCLNYMCLFDLLSLNQLPSQRCTPAVHRCCQGICYLYIRFILFFVLGCLQTLAKFRRFLKLGCSQASVFVNRIVLIIRLFWRLLLSLYSGLDSLRTDFSSLAKLVSIKLGCLRTRLSQNVVVLELGCLRHGQS